MKQLPKLTGRWQNCYSIAEEPNERDFQIIVGEFDGQPAMGALWNRGDNSFPRARGGPAPIVIPSPFREIILNSLNATTDGAAVQKARDLLL